MKPKVKKLVRFKHLALAAREMEAAILGAARRKMKPWNGKDEPDFEVETPWNGKI